MRFSNAVWWSLIFLCSQLGASMVVADSVDDRLSWDFVEISPVIVKGFLQLDAEKSGSPKGNILKLSRLSFIKGRSDAKFFTVSYDVSGENYLAEIQSRLGREVIVFGVVDGVDAQKIQPLSEVKFAILIDERGLVADIKSVMTENENLYQLAVQSQCKDNAEADKELEALIAGLDEGGRRTVPSTKYLS